MTPRQATVLLGALGMAWGIGAGCSRANLDAITASPGPDGGGDGGEKTTCPTAALEAGDTTERVQVGSMSRSYVLHVPAAYNGSKPVPLVVDFHPISGSGSRERAGSPYPALTDPAGAIMAFPNGIAGPAGTAWNVGPCCVANVDDVAFARALVAKVQAAACIDPRRVYAVGTSMGGGMAYYLACHAADVFAAIAPAAFDMVEENAQDCQPPRAVTVISFRGSADTLVPYAGGPSSFVPGMPVMFLGAQGTFDKWADIDRCTGGAAPEDANGCASYSNCQAGVEVTLCTKAGGVQEEANASVAWPVLMRHTL